MLLNSVPKQFVRKLLSSKMVLTLLLFLVKFSRKKIDGSDHKGTDVNYIVSIFLTWSVSFS